MESDHDNYYRSAPIGGIETAPEALYQRHCFMTLYRICIAQPVLWTDGVIREEPDPEDHRARAHVQAPQLQLQISDNFWEEDYLSL